MAADLVLTGSYTAIETSVDASMYMGGDGLVIHEGDHLHDPCNNHTGVKFTTVGDKGESDGFIVVNDCQIIKCRKWTTEDGNFGGETTVWDIIVHDENSNDETPAIAAIKAITTDKETNGLPAAVAVTHTFEIITWSVLEAPTCSCGEDCFVGKFLHVENYDEYINNDCELEGARPGSIPCWDVEEVTGGNETAAEEPIVWEYTTEPTADPIVVEPTISEQIKEIIPGTESLSTEAIAGIAAGVVVAFILVCYFCYRPRNKQTPVATEEKIPAPVSEGTDEESQAGEGADKKKQDAVEEARSIPAKVDADEESQEAIKEAAPEAVAEKSPSPVLVEDSNATEAEPALEEKNSVWGFLGWSKSHDVESVESVTFVKVQEEVAEKESEEDKKEGEKDKKTETAITKPEGNTEVIEWTCCGFE